MDKKFYLGLDIGTDSCGFAVTDENYNIVKAKGKRLWGVRLFENANVAKGRREKRSARRNVERRKLKIQWLQDIFKKEIEKVDKDFFARLKYSSLWLDDKNEVNLISSDSLFAKDENGEGLDDKEFYDLENNRTIYHLRKELLTNPAKDIRFLYLAIHNILKHRGNFLFEGEMGSNSATLKNVVNEVIDKFSEVSENNEIIVNDFKKLEDDTTLLNMISEKCNKTDLKNKFKELLCVKDKFAKELVDSFVSGKFNLKNLMKLLDKGEDKWEIVYDAENFDEEIGKVEDVLGADFAELFLLAGKVYSLIKLKYILKKNDYICESMVESFDLHKNQLKSFKAFIKKYYSNKYAEIFRDEFVKDKNGKMDKGKVNYSLYINNTLTNGKKQILELPNFNPKNPDRQSSFYAYIKGILGEEPTCELYDSEEFKKEKEEILNLIENKEFLVKQRIKDNAVFPNNLLIKEAKKILETNKEKYAFLSEVDADGLSNIDKILQIIKFRIPYFVGPLGNKNSKYSWSVKKNDAESKNLEIRPWTMDKIFDLDACEDEFIKRMTNKCTYINKEDVLPKCSLLYSKFMVLNELNNLCINSENISVQLKQDIFNDLFKKNKKVTVKGLKNYLVSKGLYQKDEVENLNISGIDKEFVNNYSTYINFVNIFGEDFVLNNENVIEEIIKMHTIISDKNRLANRIEREFGDLITTEQIKKIKALNFSGWGRLSRMFLYGLEFLNRKTGALTNIITEMWDNNYNITKILSMPFYDINEKLTALANDSRSELVYQDVDELYCSPSVKRGIWQSVQVVQELSQAIGADFDKIFVEVTRSDEEKGDKGRTKSRHKLIEFLYKSKDFDTYIKKNKNFIYDSNVEKNLDSITNAEMQNERVLLYFLQNGKSVYSGKPLDFDDVLAGRSYDVDHIIPRSLIKDDSINNKVLVEKELNQKDKSDAYPILVPSILKNIPLWETLKNAKLMTQEKFNRLTRKTPLSEDELNDFIARQLVTTNQSVKAVCDLLNSMNNKTTIVCSKASLVSEFRSQFKIVKNRDVNDLHHAKDAYLNIVVGNVYDSYFTNDYRNFSKQYKTLIKQEDDKKEDTPKEQRMNIVRKLFNRRIHASYKSETLVWNGQDDIERIKDTCYKNGCIISRMATSKSNGEFYDETHYKATRNNEKSNLIPVKRSENSFLNDVSKYGGYNSAKIAYFMVVESDDKKGRKITVEGIPYYIVQRFKNDEAKINQWAFETFSLVNPKIMIPKLKYKSTLLIDNGEFWLGGKSVNRLIIHNANQWYADKNTNEYIKLISKFTKKQALKNKGKEEGEIEKEEDKDIIQINSKQSLSKIENVLLYETIINQLSKKIYKDTPMFTVCETLSKSKDKFKNLTIYNQFTLLNNLVRYLGTGPLKVDLTLIGESVGSGIYLLNKNITNKNIKLVIKSVTGLYEKVIKLSGN